MTNGKSRISWTGRYARQRFVDAFASPHQKPPWFDSFRIVPGRHDGPHHIAEAVCDGKIQRIKVLASSNYIDGFTAAHPGLDVHLVIVRSSHGHSQIRRQVFTVLARALGKPYDQPFSVA